MLFRSFTTPALFRGIDRVPAWAERPVMPAVDVVETEGAWRITAELPGMDEKAVDVTIAGDVLTLKGEKTEEKDEDRTGTRVTERRYGAFARSFTLPPGIDRGAIDAAFANGVLTVTLPKLAAETPAETRIEVKAA